LNRKPGRPVDTGKENIREKYLEISRKLFLEHGYKNTSLGMISIATGYNKTNLYTYWKDGKKQLFDEIVSCVKIRSISEACEFPEEFAMVVEKKISESGKLIKALSELSPELLVSLL